MKETMWNNLMPSKLLVFTIVGLLFSCVAFGQTMADSVEKKDENQPEDKRLEVYLNYGTSPFSMLAFGI